MANYHPDVFKILERTKQIDPGAFAMNVDTHGLPAGFVEADDARREAAYRRACDEIMRGVPA